MMLRITFSALLLITVGATPLLAADVPQAAAKATKPKLAKNETAIYITNMHCPTCAKKIAGKLYRVKGVMKVKTDVKKNLAIITPQSKKQVDVKAAWAAVHAAGFKPAKLVGPQGTYVAQEKSKEPIKQAESTVPQPS